MHYNDIQNCQHVLFTAVQSESLSGFNAAGKSLADLMHNKICLANIREEIRLFLANLEIYGSMPLDTCSDSKDFFITDYMSQSRFQSLAQISQCIRKLEQICTEDHRPISKTIFTNPLLASVLNLDIPRVITILKKIRQVLRMKKAASTSQNAYVIGEEDSDDDSKEKEAAHDLEAQLPSELASQAPTDKGLRQDNTDMIMSTNPSFDEEDEDLGQLGKPAFATMCQPTTIQVGHYIYLRCGHNGNFLTIERKVFERHLHRAGCLSAL